jgi:hypothetical protein
MIGWRFVLASAATCGRPVPASTPENHVDPEPDEPVAAPLQIFVDDQRDHCPHGARDHVEIAIDGRSVGSIEVITINRRW